MNLYRVPRPFRHLYAIKFFSWADTESSHLREGRFVHSPFPVVDGAACIYSWQFLIKYPFETTLQADDCLGCISMTVDSYMRSRFQHVQRPLRRILGRRPQVIVLPEALILLRFPMQY